MQRRWTSFKKIVRLWVELFDRHSLLTYASAIALRALIAAVPLLAGGGCHGHSGRPQPSGTKKSTLWWPRSRLHCGHAPGS